MEGGTLPEPYSEPVAQLLRLGEPSGPGRSWQDDSTAHLTEADVPELIRMATDESLNTADSNSLLVWAPVHAWRALGRLRATSAIGPLLGLLHRIDDDNDDWVGEDLPFVMGLIGPAAIPALSVYLQDGSHGLWARIAASESLARIGEQHPEGRDACVAALTRQLEDFAGNGEDLNAFLVLALTDLTALESAPVMERAFAADAVDLSIQGDWEDVQIELGLLDKRLTPRPEWEWIGPGISVTSVSWPKPPAQHTQPRSNTKKKKAQKKARKKNRRK